MLTATLPGSNVLQNTFCCVLLAGLRQKNAVKNSLEIKRGKTIAMIRSTMKERKVKTLYTSSMNKAALNCYWPK